MKRALLLLLPMLTACSDDVAPPEWDWSVPYGYPAPRVPADNPMNAAKVELGRRLFYEPSLSANGQQSCASCHQQAFAFTEPRALSVGSTGEVHRRSSMSLANVGYAPRLNWADDSLDLLEDQALVPLFGTHPVELGNADAEEALLERIKAEARYHDLFAQAFPEVRPEERISVDTITKALAAFQRTLFSFNSRYDRFTKGRDPSALTAQEQRGMTIFFTDERFECFHCHGDFTFSAASTHENTTFEEVSFHNNALYNVDGRGGYPARDTGLFELTGFASDMGRFKAPTLRNIAVTAPYMHDGSIATLEEVLEHYANGGRHITEGPDAGDGRLNPYKSEFVRGFEATAEEKAALLAFLRALTDESFLTNPDFGPPEAWD